MPVNRNAPSEFGGKQQQRNRTQPLPHLPDASEELMLTYTTGDPSGINPFTGRPEPDSGEAFDGLIPRKTQEALRKAAGDLDKGQVWEQLVEDARNKAASK